MRINTLTTYDVYNYGASLQAYALMNYLGRLGHEVELINYKPEYLTRKYDYRWVNPESKLSKYMLTRLLYRIAKYLQRKTTMGRKRAFDIFNSQFLHTTKTLYHSFDELVTNPPDADLFIVGSDQIWNVFYETGRDPAFYLNFVNNGRKASYAASFSYLDIDADNMRRISLSLSSFDAVSVREYHGLSILKEMGVPAEWVLDPVFLLSIEDWKDVMTDFKSDEKYLLIYDFEKNDELRRFCLEYAKRKHLKIYSINDTYPLSYADRNFNSAGPREFLSLIYHCDAFVSNSFHGTAFSILFNKPFFVFNRSRHKVNSRMESLMALFEHKDCILFEDTLTAAYDKEFDFNRINEIIVNEQEKSKAFLMQLI